MFRRVVKLNVFCQVARAITDTLTVPFEESHLAAEALLAEYKIPKEVPSVKAYDGAFIELINDGPFEHKCILARFPKEKREQ